MVGNPKGAAGYVQRGTTPHQLADLVWIASGENMLSLPDFRNVWIVKYISGGTSPLAVRAARIAPRAKRPFKSARTRARLAAITISRTEMGTLVSHVRETRSG